MAAAFDIKAKVSPKGCVSLYGLGQRWPVSLYPDQWEAVAEKMNEIVAFVRANADECEKRAAATRSDAKGTTDDTGKTTL